MNSKRHAQLIQALEQFLPRLVAHYQPERVILFGSVAYGDVGEWSDLDLLIIKNTSLPFIRRLREVALLCHASVGVDFFVYTPAEVAQMYSENNPFLEEVLRTGKVLYEREPAETLA